MRALQVNTPAAAPELALVELPMPSAKAGEVLIKVHCVSLNRRDLAFLHRAHPARPDHPIIPCSDMTGQVVIRGAGVDQLDVGAAVVPLFLPAWRDGLPTAAAMRPAFGGPGDGVAAEYVAVPADWVIAGIPDHLDAFQASTLSCAGLTAWAAVTAAQAPLRGRTLCVQGSGGVATYAVQFALAMGAEVAVVSRSDVKLEWMRALGARHLINIARTPAWGEELVRLAGGADLVIDHGDPAGFAEALRAVRTGGTISLVGGSGAAALTIDPRAVFTRLLRIQGIAVGSAALMRTMLAFIAEHRLRPVVGRVFDYADAAEAFATLEAGDVFGNICVSMTS